MATFDSEELGGLRFTETDKFGKKCSVGIREDGDDVSIAGENFLLLHSIAKDILTTCQLEKSISITFIEDYLADCLFDQSRGKPHQFLIVELRAAVEAAISDWDFHFPLSASRGDNAFTFAGVKYEVRSNGFDEILTIMRAPSKEHPLRSQAEAAHAEILYHDYGQCIWCCVSQRAEKQHAKTLAEAQVRRSTDLLRALHVLGYHPNKWVGLQPGQPFSTGSFHVIRDTAGLQISDSAPEGQDPIWFGRRHIEQLKMFGLDKINALAEKESKTEFEELRLRSLSVLGRLAALSDTGDKVVYACSVLDSMFVRDQNEPIIATMPRRVALFLGSSVGERKEILKSIKAGYGVRSKKVHHGIDQEADEDLFEFFAWIWNLAIRLASGEYRYKTKKELLDSLDERMLKG